MFFSSVCQNLKCCGAIHDPGHASGKIKQRDCLWIMVLRIGCLTAHSKYFFSNKFLLLIELMKIDPGFYLKAGGNARCGEGYV